MQGITAGFIFDILTTIASVVGGAMLLRFWTQIAWVRPPAPLGKFIYTMTDWWVLKVRRFLPAKGRFDLASLLGTLLIALLLQLILLVLTISWSNLAEPFGWLWLPGIGNAVLEAVFTVLNWMYWGIMALMILGALFSWINPHAPLAPYVQALSEPILRPVRQVLPLIAGIDFSPMVVILILQLLVRLKLALVMGLAGAIG